jgi:hypothetical protein
VRGYTYNVDAVSDKLKLVHHELEQSGSIGAYLISERAAVALKAYQRESDSSDEFEPYKVYEAYCDAARKCIAIIKEEAIRELS